RERGMASRANRAFKRTRRGRSPSRLPKGMKRVRPASSDTDAHAQTSASHFRGETGAFVIKTDWPATRSVYVAIRGEVKRKMDFAANGFRHAPDAAPSDSLDAGHLFLFAKN